MEVLPGRFYLDDVRAWPSTVRDVNTKSSCATHPPLLEGLRVRASVTSRAFGTVRRAETLARVKLEGGGGSCVVLSVE